jgi:hypothetical protein
MASVESIINKFLIRILMGGKDQRIQKDSSENLPETMGSVKQFFE